jgi:hypothetical protein
MFNPFPIFKISTIIPFSPVLTGFTPTKEFQTYLRIREVYIPDMIANSTFRKEFLFNNKGQFKKKVKLSHVYNEVTSEPTIKRYASIIRRTLEVLTCYLANTQCGNPVSHGTHKSDSPFLSRLFPACPCLWLPQRL